jgi:hypothetical protein
LLARPTTPPTGRFVTDTITSEARRADRLAGASITVRSVSERQSPSMSLTGLRRMVCLVSLEWEQVVVAAQEPAALGRWWADALGWVVVNDSAEEFEIRPSADRLPGLVFLPVSEAKLGKNRLHLDFRPDDQQAEVERFIRAGARRVDIGQGKPTWVVLADPEGNEFCVLAAPRA